MDRKQLVHFGTLFAVVVAVLALAYFLFLRADYVVLFEDLREEDTAEIVAELEQLGIDYRLAGGGHSILVPEGLEDEARIGIAGSNIALGGVVGFELFNESDMGLTEFAQQVNYQRALQGELARTIMMMDGVEFARVHISLPERRLFRNEELGPKAAVTVQPHRNVVLGADRVRGIQRLVASAVTELDVADVSVLDERGQLISTDATRLAQAGVTLDEKSALEAYYRARAENAAAPYLPGSDFEARVTATRVSPQPAEETEDGKDTAPSTQARDFTLGIAFRTPFELAAADRDEIGEAIAQAVGMQRANGDRLRFEVADLEAPASIDRRMDPVARDTGASPADIPAAGATRAASWIEDLAWQWWSLMLAFTLLPVAVILWRRGGRMNEAERADFAQQLDAMLSRRQEQGGG